MWDFIIENIGTIAVAALLLAVVIGIVFSIVRRKRAGKSACGCGCSGCPLSGECHKQI